jgi:5'-3' exonuclease
MSTTLLIVDFSAVFWRHWHASASEALTYARQRTVDHVRSMAANYTHTIVAFDSPNCWRLDIWPEYKANRPPKDEAALEQMRQAQADLSSLYPTAAHERWEADDVIAELTTGLPHDWSACVLSADKDLVQLLGDRVTMHHLSRNEVITATMAEDAINLPLHSYADYLALCGDKSDNVLGVQGVGPVRAAELLQKHESIDGIYYALDEDEEQFTPKLRQALKDARKRENCSIWTAQKLVKLPAGYAPACAIDPVTIIKNWKPTKENTVTIDEADYDEPQPAPTASAPTPTIPQPAPSQPSSSTRAIVPTGDWQRALEPADSKGAYGLAKVVVASRMFSGYGTPEQAMLVIMAGREFGLGAMASLRSFHVVEGKPTMSAQSMMARCLEHTSCRLFRVVRSRCTNELAVVEVQRHGWPEPETYTWSIEDAKRAGLASRPNWSKYPREMLINRCIAEAARFVWPEVMAGVYAPEEFGGAS